MKAEKPAKSISRGNHWGDAVVYNIDCECTDPDHSVVAWIEVSKEDDFPEEVEVTFYVNTNFARWGNVWERLKIAAGVLFGNGYQQNHSLLLKKQGALNVAAAIEATIEELESDSDQKSDA